MSRSSLSVLRAEARALAGRQSAPAQKVRAAGQTHIGTVGRARAGPGETFWQYRHHAFDDGTASIDWRRSAREDELFVREHELERPRNWLFWFDAVTGFDWSSSRLTPNKSERAIVLIMAMIDALSRTGECCGTLDGACKPVSGQNASGRVGRALWSRQHLDDFPATATGKNTIPVLIGDFYADNWRERLSDLIGDCRRGLVVALSDPAELYFPFSGRTRLYMPGASNQSRLFGRAESIRQSYLERFAARRREIRELLMIRGWKMIEHCTDEPAHEAFRAMLLAYADIRAL